MKTTANASVDIKAPAERVWQALTDPQMVKQYFFGTDLKSDWKEGSPITFSGEWEGKSYEDKGVIKKIVPNQELSYTYFSSMSGKEDKPENYNMIHCTLHQQGDSTRLDIAQEGEMDEKAKEHSEGNWKMVMEGMKKLLEGSGQ